MFSRRKKSGKQTVSAWGRGAPDPPGFASRFNGMATKTCSMSSKRTSFCVSSPPRCCAVPPACSCEEAQRDTTVEVNNDSPATVRSRRASKTSNKRCASSLECADTAGFLAAWRMSEREKREEGVKEE